MPINTEAATPFAEAALALCPDGPPRVWSFIVTVFGDTAGDGSADIAAGPLARILAPAGISGAAMRVALHRLKVDGWITARRVGRSSAYKLHPDRLAETQAASRRIYAAEPPTEDAWQVLIGPPGAAVGQPGAVPIAPRIALRPKPAASLAENTGADQSGSAHMLILDGRSKVPSWLRAEICPDDLLDAYAALYTGLHQVERLTRGAVFGTPAETIALRLLVVHAWRRVLLRHPHLPDQLFPEGWKGADCRHLVTTLLARLPRPSEAEIAQL
ncbi:MAG: PaaX family transcriptional regulator C-terminal domain-containing protein [Pseudomonadota bacterium]